MTEPEDTRRRHFLLLAGTAVLLPAAARARQLDEADPAAVALGYRTDTKQVDAARYPQHAPSQICASCRYFQGKSGAEWAPCTIFAGKGDVHSNGWCAVYSAR